VGVFLDYDLYAFGELLEFDFFEVLHGVVGFEENAEPSGEGVAVFLEQVTVCLFLLFGLLTYL
jgi:hypothetical protein